MTEALTPRVIALFLVVVFGQIGGSMLLAATSGFTRVGWSALCIALYAASLWSLAALIKGGAPLSLMMPILAAVVPLCTMIIGVTVLGEAASWSRIGLLCLSCLVIGGASMV